MTNEMQNAMQPLMITPLHLIKQVQDAMQSLMIASLHFANQTRRGAKLHVIINGYMQHVRIPLYNKTSCTCTSRALPEYRQQRGAIARPPLAGVETLHVCTRTGSPYPKNEIKKRGVA